MSNEWNGDERRGSQFNVRSQIMRLIDAENDHKARNQLMLMLGIIEAMDAGFARVEKKIDIVLKDEEAIKRIALNGLVPTHHDDHDWLKVHRRDHVEVYRPLLERAAPMLEWMEGFKQRQEEAEKDKKTLAMRFLSAIVSHIGTAIGVAIVAWVALK